MRAWLIVLGATAIAHAGGPPMLVLVPPAEVDLGTGIASGEAVVGHTTELLAGAHWASLAWKPTRFDVGAGFVGSWRGVLPQFAMRSGAASGDDMLRLYGGYLDAGYALDTRRHWRTFVSSRVELMPTTA